MGSDSGAIGSSNIGFQVSFSAICLTLPWPIFRREGSRVSALLFPSPFGDAANDLWHFSADAEEVRMEGRYRSRGF